MGSEQSSKESHRTLGIALVGVSGTRSSAQFIIFAYVSISGGLSQAGTLALAYAISGPIFVFLNMGLRTLILTHLKNFDLRSLEFVRIWASIIAVAFSAVLAFLISPETMFITLAIAMTKVPDSFGEIYSSFMQKSNRVSKMAIPQLVVVISQTAIFITIFTLDKNLIMAAIGSIFVGAFLQILYSRQICKNELSRQNLRQEKINRKVLLYQGMPIGFGDGILSFSVNMPILVLANYFDADTVAVFSFGMYLISGVELVLNGLSQAWIPSAKKLRNKKILRVSTTVSQGLKWLPIVLTFLVLGYAALVLFFDLFDLQVIGIPQLSIYAIFLVALIEPFMFASSTALNVLNKYKSGLVSSIIAFALVTISAFVLVPILEITGAFISLGVLILTRLLVNQIILFKLSKTH